MYQFSEDALQNCGTHFECNFDMKSVRVSYHENKCQTLLEQVYSLIYKFKVLNDKGFLIFANEHIRSITNNNSPV